jgi:REP element-mobilizing transposase RayT
MTIGMHLILSGYGTWVSNDLRGSGSEETRKPELDALGPIHQGRKPNHLQPSRQELRGFYREVEPVLNFETLWFRDERERAKIGAAFAEVVAKYKYTVWAAAVCANHAHQLVRLHRDDVVTIWDHFANASRVAVKRYRNITDGHPVWSSRPFRVYLETPPAVRDEIDYIRKNPMKEGLPEQHWDFATPYNDWPLHNKRRSR